MFVVGVRFYSEGIFLLCSWQYDWQCPKPILSVAISTDILLHKEFATHLQQFYRKQIKNSRLSWKFKASRHHVCELTV